MSSIFPGILQFALGLIAAFCVNLVFVIADRLTFAWGYRVDPYPDYYVDIYSDGVLLVMLAAGLSSIVAVMLRRHRLALFLLGLAAGAFVNRSFVEVFYNDVNVIT